MHTHTRLPTATQHLDILHALANQATAPQAIDTLGLAWALGATLPASPHAKFCLMSMPIFHTSYLQLLSVACRVAADGGVMTITQACGCKDPKHGFHIACMYMDCPAGCWMADSVSDITMYFTVHAMADLHDLVCKLSKQKSALQEPMLWVVQDPWLPTHPQAAGSHASAEAAQAWRVCKMQQANETGPPGN